MPVAVSSAGKLDVPLISICGRALGFDPSVRFIHNVNRRINVL